MTPDDPVVRSTMTRRTTTQRRLQATLASITLAADTAGDHLGRAERLISCLEGALDLIGEGVVICDGDGREVYRNHQATDLVPSVLDGALIGEAIDARLAEARQGSVSEGALELFSPTRRILIVRAFPLPPEAGARPAGAVAIVEDASERRQVDAIRRDFVANVSHELKTPVGAISLLAETLEEEDDPAVIARLSQRMATEAERLGLIIDDLLDLSRIEANEPPPPAPIAVAELLDGAVDALRPLAAAGDITLEVSPATPDLIVLCDRRDLVSAISNLVDNAIKYSERGGRVRVTVSATGGMVHIAVTDRGIGIPPRDQARVFERFYRVDRARSRTTGGTGLGLSIVRHVAANHGGTVRVTSKEGEGSTFVLRLPLARGAGAPAREPERGAGAGRRREERHG